VGLTGSVRVLAAVAAVSLLATAGASAARAASHASCTPTPSDGGGPDRGTPPLRARIGTGHVLTGIVLSPDCKPVARARVSFWQAGRGGRYTPAGQGSVLTNRAGRFRFEGPMPPPYEGRPAHIHIKVESGDFEPLYTRYEPRGGRRGSVRLVLSPSDL
jgi:protocatechuate 3,4-dioxygenase beta subunit